MIVRVSRRRIGWSASVVSVVLLTFGATPVHAAPHDIVDGGAAGLLTVETSPTHFDATLDPGESDEWLLTVRSDAATPGALTLAIASSGALASTSDGITLEIAECTAPWMGAPGATSCPGTSTTHLASTPFAVLDPLADRSLGSIASGGVRYLRLTVALSAAPPSELQGTDADFVVTFRGVGEAQVTTDSPGQHPPTGFHDGASLLLAATLGVGGTVLIALAGVSRRRAEETHHA